MTKQQALIKTAAFVRHVLEQDLKQKVTAKTVREAAEKIIRELPSRTESKTNEDHAVA